jgi:predicted metal-dependent phosphoesterase TrpH
MHTTASDGLGTPEQLVETVARLGLDVIAVTDHDTTDGAQRVRDLVARGGYAFEVIVGIEVTTERGMHLLGLFVERPIPMFQTVERSIEAIVAQGGICLAPHPLSPLTPSLGRGVIERLLAAGYPLIGVETLNPSPAGRVVERKVRAFNKVWGLAEFGGSDAHFLVRVGSAYTAFDGRTAADFRRGLLDRTTSAHASIEPPARVPFSDYLRQSGRSMIVNPAQKVARRVRRARGG